MMGATSDLFEEVIRRVGQSEHVCSIECRTDYMKGEVTFSVEVGVAQDAIVPISAGVNLQRLAEDEATETFAVVRTLQEGVRNAINDAMKEAGS